MDLLELKIFRDIAREKNFTKVAKLNFLTQPSISLYLKQLEKKLGSRLFERVPRKVALTEDGKLLLPHVEEILLKSENLKTLLARSRGVPRGNIKIATIYSIGMYELAPFLKRFIRRYPEIHIHLQYRHSDTIYDLVAENKVDVGLVAYPENRDMTHIIPFGNDNLVLIAPPNHKIAKQKSVRLESINGERFIAFDNGVPTRRAIDSVLEQNGVKTPIRMTNENIDTLKRAVEVGLGISIVPSKTIKEELRKGTLKSVNIRDIKLNRPLGILTLKERIQSFPVQLFIQMLTKNKRKQSGSPTGDYSIYRG